MSNDKSSCSTRTPHAYEAFESLGVSDEASAQALAKKIAQLINSEVKPQRGVRVEQDDLSFDIRYVNQVAEDEYLLRIVDLLGDSDTAVLKKEFALTDRESEVLSWISNIINTTHLKTLYNVLGIA